MQTCDTDSILHSGKCVIYEDESYLHLPLEGLGEHVQVEGHLLDLVLEQGVTPPFFIILKLDHFAYFLNLILLELKLTCNLKLKIFV